MRTGHEKPHAAECDLLKGFAGFHLSRVAPVVWFALSSAIVFYALPAKPCIPVFCAFLLVGLANVRSSFLYLACQEDESRWHNEPRQHVEARAWTNGISQFFLLISIGAIAGAACLDLEKSNDTPAELSSFQLSACSGVACADSQRTKSDNLLLTLGLDEMEITSVGFRARLSWPKCKPRLTIIADFAGDIAAGQRVHFTRISAIDATKGLYFAEADRAGLLHDPLSSIQALRWACKKAFRSQVAKISGSARPLAEALLIGIRDDLDADINTLFRDAGCSHILSLSGQHLAILGTLVSLLASKFIKNKAVLDWVSFCFATLYTWIVGVSPPLLRSVYMLGFALVFRSLDRPQDGLAVLAYCFVLSVLLDPDSARSLSFILSYAAMIGLIVLAPRWQNVLWRLPPFLAAPLAASLAALCSTALIQIDTFGTLILGGIIPSTLSGPLILVFMWSLLGSCLVSVAMPFLSGILALWHEWIYEAIVLTMRIGKALPGIVAETASEKALLGTAVVACSLCVYASPYIEWHRYYAKRVG